MCSNILFLLFTIYLVSNLSNGQKEKKFFRKGYNYFEVTKSFYKFHAFPRTWRGAKHMCELEGAEFFYPKDKSEAGAVLALWKETYPFNEVFVGVSDLIAKGVFEAIYGNSIDDIFNNWAPGEPNNGFGTQYSPFGPPYYRRYTESSEEDCVILKKDGTYNDISCVNKYPFICKKSIATLEWNKECNMPDADYKFNERLGRCYKFHGKPLNWTDAHAVCSAEQSYLAVINSQQEAAYLAAMAESAAKDYVTGVMDGSVLLGFHDRYEEGWQTVKGTSLKDSGYNSWGYGQPDGPPRGVDERCGAMFYNGKLNDIHCNKESFFICEHDVMSI